VVFGLSAILVMYASANSQSPSRSSDPQNMQNREWALGHVKEEINSHFKRESKPSLPTIRDDFRRLQIVDNELMRRVFVQNLFDADQIRASVSEIKKHASRLRASISFGEPTVEASNKNSNQVRPERTAAGEVQNLSAMLLQMDQAVMSFVNNPLFQQPKVLDSKLALQAGKDLDQVLQLTERLHRSLATNQRQQR
jgi:hypothetical protein